MLLIRYNFEEVGNSIIDIDSYWKYGKFYVLESLVQLRLFVDVRDEGKYPYHYQAVHVLWTIKNHWKQLRVKKPGILYVVIAVIWHMAFHTTCPRRMRFVKEAESLGYHNALIYRYVLHYLFKKLCLLYDYDGNGLWKYTEKGCMWFWSYHLYLVIYKFCCLEYSTIRCLLEFALPFKTLS